MPKSLLLEIGTEELPSSFVDAALAALPGLVRTALEGIRLPHGDIRALGTARPTENALPHADYQYEKIVHVPDTTRIGRIDLYKKGHFVIEAKCGRNAKGDEGSAPIRGTAAWSAYIEDAYNSQARVYAKLLPEGRPPVLIVVDVGH